MDAAPVLDYFRGLQDRIVAALEDFDGARFRADAWTRPEGAKQSQPPGPLPKAGGGVGSLNSQNTDAAGSERSVAGGGLTRLIEDGHFFERGGVNLSHVSGSQLPHSATAARPALAGRAWEAMGVSLVLHPRNPYCPTAHMNVRCFIARKDGEESVWWFGGGMDLTPYYGFEEDAQHFHRTCKETLAPFGAGVHARFKTWCDEYFFLKHRNEPRGVGGIFFDDLNEGGPGGDTSTPWSFQRCFSLAQAVGEAFLPAYLPIAARRRDLPYGARERDFQAYRRGRYVEFNLVWDRGTLFGLQSGGRTESILMSLPPLVKWRYDWKPEPGSAEERLYTVFLKPRDWA